MRILITNDDGVYSDGLWQLAGELSKVADIVVVAPDREQSGVGTAVSLHRPIRAREITSWCSAPCYAVEGTPSDCVILGLGSFCRDRVDMLFSGINDGANLGDDVLISGTVGAALQGHFAGIPSFAISVGSLRDPQYTVAARFAAVLANQFKDGQVPPGLLLNVNVPNASLDEIQGVEITRLAVRSYADVVKEDQDSRGKAFHWITRGEPGWTVEEGTDIWAMRQKKISITPLRSSLASSDRVEDLAKLCPHLIDSLRAPLP